MNEPTTWKVIVAAVCDPDVPFLLPINDLEQRYADPDGLAAHRKALEAALSRHADTERMISYRRYCIHHQSTPDDPLLTRMFRTPEIFYAQPGESAHGEGEQLGGGQGMIKRAPKIPISFMLYLLRREHLFW